MAGMEIFFVQTETYEGQYNGLFKYGKRAIIENNGNIYAKITESYACIKRCITDSQIIEKKRGCYYPNQGTNFGTLATTRPSLKPDCN